MGIKIPVYLVRDPSNEYFPLSLGLMRSHLSCFDFAEDLQFFGNLTHSLGDILQTSKVFGPGIWLFSDYIWSVRRNLELSQALKAQDARNLIIHGGPSLPKYPAAYREFAETHPYVDVGIRGEGELTLGAVFQAALKSSNWSKPDLSAVNGISFRSPEGELSRTGDAQRNITLDALPSPYLSGYFDKVKGLAWIVETNRGCPYSCSFCDWGSLTAQKIKKFGLQRVKDELTWGAKRGLEVLFLADANFGIFERDLELAEHIGNLYRSHGSPRECNITFAKNSNSRVGEILRVLSAAGVKVDGNIAIQTTDPATLRAVGRSNLSKERYDELLEICQADGIAPSTDLMVCLPGQTLETFKKDIQTYMDRDVGLLIHHTYMLPNSPMASPEYRAKWELETDAEGRVLASKSFSKEQGQQLVALRNAYFLAEFYCFFRYLMRFLQWDHGIPSTRFLEALAQCEGPWSVLIREPQLSNDFSLSRTLELTIQELHQRGEDLYDGVRDWLHTTFSVEFDTAFETALLVNQAVLPNLAREYPLEVPLQHDFVAYFEAAQSGHWRALSSYAPGHLQIDLHPDGLVEPRRRTSRDWVWELESPLLRLSRSWRYAK